AAAKRAAGLPIVDPAREAAVVGRAGERATAATLDPSAMRRLAEAQIAAARAVQEAAPAGGPGGTGADVPPLPTIRPAIAALDTALARARVAARDARRARPDVPEPRRADLSFTLRTDAEIAGFDEAHAGAIAAAIAAVLSAS